jgi:hypothetical protein
VSTRFAALLAGLWAGLLLCIATIATPAPFATLAMADAGRVVGRIFAIEAYVSLALALVLFLLERAAARRRAAVGEGSAFSADLVLILGALFCTVLGYFALQPMMAAARAGQGRWSFGALHAVSFALFGLKGLLVLALAWRRTGVMGLGRPARPGVTPPPSA